MQLMVTVARDKRARTQLPWRGDTDQGEGKFQVICHGNPYPV